MAAAKTARKPVAKKSTAKKPAAKRTVKRVECGVECRGTDGHKATGCSLEKGHGGMHWHSGRSKQHVYNVF